MTDWHQDWFNEDYIKLYAHRDENEAKEHVDFLQRATDLKQGRVLDLGCGMGRHSILLAKRGFEVVGVDASSVLLEEAGKRAGEAQVRWIEADFRHLPEIGKFDLILSMFTSFGYFETDKENAAILNIAASHLAPGGFFFLDFLDPEAVATSLVENETQEVNGEKVKITRSIEDRFVIKRIEFSENSYFERVKLYNRAEIEQMAYQQGLRLHSFWNQYDSQSPKRQLFMFQI